MACRHYDFCLNVEHRHHIPDNQYNNCVLCVAEQKGPLTQEEVGDYLNLTKMRISQIERQALNKIKKRSAILKNALH